MSWIAAHIYVIGALIHHIRQFRKPWSPCQGCTSEMCFGQQKCYAKAYDSLRDRHDG